jgi:hypothetical protein
LFIAIRYLKEIAGIACKKAILAFFNKASAKDKIVWYAPDIIIPFKYNFGVVGLELLKGLPMEYNNEQGVFMMKHTEKKLTLRRKLAMHYLL